MSAANEWGFTNSPADLEAVIRWREQAIADGWTCEPLYFGSQPAHTAAKLKRKGWIAQVIARTREPGKWAYQAQVNVWGPDRLCVSVGSPPIYDFKELVAGLRRCDACGRTDVETQRYAFAGRCCAACLPGMQKKHEYPGWAD